MTISVRKLAALVLVLATVGQLTGAHSLRGGGEAQQDGPAVGHVGCRTKVCDTVLDDEPFTEPSTAEPSTAGPITAEPSTAEPTTAGPITAEPSTAEPTTAGPITAEPSTAEPTTAGPITAEPSTAEPSTAGPITAEPSTAEPTAAGPITAEPSTAEPTTAGPITAEPSTAEPTTAGPTTAGPTTAGPTTAGPITAEPSTAEPTTAEPTTTTNAPTPPPLTDCPPQDELTDSHCLCDSNSLTLTCNKLTAHFPTIKRYSLQRLVIKDTPYTELVLPPEFVSGQISFRSLSLVDNQQLERIESQLIKLFDESIEIVRNPNLQSVDWSQFSTQLTSISISNVTTVENFNPELINYHKLKELRLSYLNFDRVNDEQTLSLSSKYLPALRHLEIQHTNLEGKFSFYTAGDCDQYTINLASNNIRSFDFDSLFPDNKPNCRQFRVDLSQNIRIDPELLVSHLSLLKQHIPELDVQLSNVNLDCNCELYKLYHHHESGVNIFSKHFHDIYCASYWKQLQDVPFDEIC